MSRSSQRHTCTTAPVRHGTKDTSVPGRAHDPVSVNNPGAGATISIDVSGCVGERVVGAPLGVFDGVGGGPGLIGVGVAVRVGVDIAVSVAARAACASNPSSRTGAIAVRRVGRPIAEDRFALGLIAGGGSQLGTHSVNSSPLR